MQPSRRLEEMSGRNQADAAPSSPSLTRHPTRPSADEDIIHAVKGRRPARHATVTSERLAHNTRRDTTAAGGSSADVGADRPSAREPPAELGDSPVGTEASSRVWPADCRSHGVARRPAHACLYISARLRWTPDPRVATSALQSGFQGWGSVYVDVSVRCSG